MVELPVMFLASPIFIPDDVLLPPQLSEEKSPP
jgi:hypothetical protein